MLTNKCRNILIMLAGVVVCICDALRDRWIDRIVGWQQWHLVKWIAFYLPFVVVIALIMRFKSRMNWLWLIGYALFCWVLWRLVYWQDIIQLWRKP